MRPILNFSLFCCSLLFVPVALAQSVDDFDEISAKLDLEFETQTKRIDDIYQAVDEAIDRAFRGLTKRIEVKWPDGAMPERHRWVTYNASMNSRAIADFESGELVVETLITSGENLQRKVAELMQMSSAIATATSAELDKQDVLLQAVTQEVEAAIEQPLQPAKTTDTSIASVLPATIGGQLEGLAEALQQDFTDIPELSSDSSGAEIAKAVEMVVLNKPGIVAAANTTSAKIAQTSKAKTPEPVIPANPDHITDDNADSAATSPPGQTVAQTNSPAASGAFDVPAPLPVLNVIEENGQTRLQLRIEFVNDYQEKLVKQYFDEIRSYAKQYDVPVSVIMAIIETESSYNPRAVSPIPAFGLMQLVPKTAGLDAHLFVHGEKKIVSADYLFNEDNNLKLGSAYFHLLTHRYLRKISDPQARFYCAVASYNTGVGNVAKTFTGSKSINGAVDAINGMTAEAVYDYLIQNLPAQETKNYLKKIVTRMEKYKQFDA